MNSLGKKIKYHLKIRNKNLKYLSKELGVTQQKLSLWVNGHADMPSSVLFQISKILGVSMDWLMDGETKDDCSRCRGDRKTDKKPHGRAKRVSNRHPKEAESGEDTRDIQMDMGDEPSKDRPFGDSG